ncbi:RNA polymerase sigma-70 factor, ECF subfamily [Hymenobacter gelipurpurascens]|uniref:RNA polymerase sigma-70 factor, ECF subfamily n=1 Tax=Hymenobacter gelipurpurascens TaxID=89968 RepID=A0A212UAT2_9BACT|nr:RNA polymerase sigma factor [Hymenobacter gelipurpurascens]SNC75339.1 RNA polymerase sigma-70 factor, ECF subfamily [Hymenobacter gelipurpurascens]
MVTPDSELALFTELLARCREQDRTSQRQLYLRYYAYAFSICLRYLHDRDAAQEAVNDGFLKVLQELPRFDASRFPDVVGSFRGWLRRLMVHTAIDHFRAANRHAFQTELEAAPDLHDTTCSPLDTLSFEELLGFIGQLPPAYRAVFNLFVIDGYTHEEIAEQLGISVGTSKSNLFKARAQLKLLLKHQQHHAYAGYIR